MALYCADGQTISGAIAAGGSGTAISVSVWVQFPVGYNGVGAGTYSYCYQQEGATAGYIRCGFFRSGTVPTLSIQMFQSGGSGATSTIAVPSLGDGSWHHVLYTFGSGFFSMWVDGVRVQRANSFRSLTYSGTVSSIIGSSTIAYGSGTVLPVAYSDLRLFNREITKNAEVRALYDGQRLDATARYCLGAAPTGTDLSGNGSDLTTVGSLSGTFTGFQDPPWLRVGMTRGRYLRRNARGFVSGGAPPTFTPRGLWFTR